MSAQQPLQAPHPAEQAPWPSAWRLFWGHLGNDGGPSKWTQWSWYSVALFAVGVAAQGLLKDRVPEVLLDGGQFLVTSAAMGILYWGTWRYIQEDLDELHRRIMLESIVFAFFVTNALVVSTGVLINFGGLPSINILWVFFVAEPSRGLGLVLAVRKYR